MVIEQVIERDYALYNGDCIDVMKGLPSNMVGLTVFSPPFGGLYTYSSDPRDLSNSKDYEQFFEHYNRFFLPELFRILAPGRMCCVHTMEFPTGNTGTDAVIEFPDDMVKAHRAAGFDYCGRRTIWKEPLRVRNKTMAKNLMHKTLCENGSSVGHAMPDYLLIFRKPGESTPPVEHPNGMIDYHDETKIPHELMRYKGYKGSQLENRYSHWIWRQYASSVWEDIRFERMLPFQPEKDNEEEKHVHPLQLDVIERCVTLYSNPNDVVFTPFMGVGSEVYGAVRNGRLGVGVELKPAYYKQAVRNVGKAMEDRPEDAQLSLPITHDEIMDEHGTVAQSFLP